MRGRTFNGTTDYVIVDPTGWGQLTGDMTIAAVIYRNSTANMNILTQNGTSTGDCGFVIDTSTVLIFCNGAGALSTTTIGVGTWLVAISKASGTSTPRAHIYSYDTGVWVHENEGTTVSSFSNTGASSLYVGSYRGSGDFFNGDIFAAGAWGYNATDTEVEGLAFNLASWLSFPACKLMLPMQGDVGTVPIPDLSAVGAGETSRSGTTTGTTRDAPVWFGRQRPTDLTLFTSSVVNGTATPSTVALSVTTPAPTVSGGAITTPAAVARSVTTPAPTVTGSSTTTPAAVALTVTTPAPSISGGANSSPAAVTLAATTPAPTTTGGGTTTPAAVAVAVVTPAPSASGSGDATATPSAVALTVSTPAPTVSGGANTTPAAVAITVVTPAPTVTGGGGASPTAVTLTITIAAPTVTGDASTSPAAVALTVTVPAVSASGGAIVYPSAVALLVVMYAPFFAATADPQPDHFTTRVWPARFTTETWAARITIIVKGDRI